MQRIERWSRGELSPNTGERIASRSALTPDHDLTVVIPAFNEQQRLPWTLGELGQFLESWGLDYRVLVADDGSSDATATLTELLGPRFATLSLPEHRGKGCAVRTAMLHATGHVVAFTDADLPFELAALREGYRQIRGGQCAVVFGARDLEQSAHKAPRRFSRTLATWVFRELVKRLISRQVTDTQCGLKLFSLQAATEVFSRATLDGFAFDAEVVLLVEQLGLRFRRIPVNLVREYASTLSVARDTLPMLWDIAALWWRNRFLRPVPVWPVAQAEATQSARRKQAA
ncbi:MAG: glycosyltransferase [Thermoguttaceae bacterium]|jgi:dolichyl-phosphate beta-glucosyltransferase